MREETSVYRDHRLSVGLCKWRRCIHLCLTQTQKVMLIYIYSELFNNVVVAAAVTTWLRNNCVLGAETLQLFPVAKGYYRTVRRHLIVEETYPCFGS